MKHLTILLVAFLAFACAPAGDSGSASTSETDANKTVIATVNGEPIYEEMVDYYRTARFGDGEGTPEQSEQVIGEITQLYAMVAEARSLGLDKDPDLAMRMKMQSLSMLAQSAMQKYNEENEITDEMVRAAYDAEATANEYKARHILVKEEAKAVELIAQLDAGGDFALLAEEHSTGPSAPRGGDLGWFPASNMVKPFGDALPGIEPGTYGKTPVQTNFGWHVILVEDVREAQKPEYAEVAPRIRDRMMTEQINEYLESVKSKAQIVNKL